MAVNKISSINDEVDIKLFLYITRKNIIYAIVFLTIALTSAYLYLRYTHPIYRAEVVIQISSEEQAANLVNFRNIYNDNLSRKVELMRSANFLSRVFSQLPMDITYYSKGTVLNFEQYKNSPFEIDAKVKDPIIYGIPLYVNFIGKNKYSISYYIINEASREKEFFITEKADFPEVELSVKLVDYNLIESKQGLFNQNSFFFVINNPDLIV